MHHRDRKTCQRPRSNAIGPQSHEPVHVAQTNLPHGTRSDGQLNRITAQPLPGDDLKINLGCLVRRGVDHTHHIEAVLAVKVQKVPDRGRRGRQRRNRQSDRKTMVRLRSETLRLHARRRDPTDDDIDHSTHPTRHRNQLGHVEGDHAPSRNHCTVEGVDTNVGRETNVEHCIMGKRIEQQQHHLLALRRGLGRS